VEVVLKRKLCQFCLDSGHRRSQCPSETDFHHTLQRQDTIHYEPTYVQKEVITASSLVPAEVTVVAEVAPVQLAIQEVKVEGRPDCVVMFDSGSQATVVLNSYAKEAGLRRVGVSNVQLLMGMDHLSLHPKEVERTGSLVLLLSFFGIRTGWIVAGNLAKSESGKAFVGAIRQGHHVPLDFLTAEALGTETLRRCSVQKMQRMPV
jgi:hypothetical protein